MDAPIGIFDSGVGGLTVARAILAALPDEPIVYVGDTAHSPYGPLPLAQIRQHAFAVMDHLMTEGVKMLVIACNSASAACLPEAFERYPVPVVGVIEPAVRRAAGITRSGRVGVVATAATVASGAYPRSFAGLPTGAATPQLQVSMAACPRFVEFVEAGVTTGPELLATAQGYLAPLRQAGVDTLVLGCTHYPLLAGVLGVVMGEAVTLVSSAEETARDVYRSLAAQDAFRQRSPAPPRHRFLATGDPLAFAALGRRFLGPQIAQVEAVLPAPAGVGVPCV